MPVQRGAGGRFVSSGGGSSGGGGGLFGMRFSLKLDMPKVKRRIEEGNFESLGRAGAYIRGMARKSIGVSPVASAPGKPPHTRKGRLKDAIVFSVERTPPNVVIGPACTRLGQQIGRLHEHGGSRTAAHKKLLKPRYAMGQYGPVRRTGTGRLVFARLTTASQVARARDLAVAANRERFSANLKRDYPKRPFMAPALELARFRLPAMWAGSVRE